MWLRPEAGAGAVQRRQWEAACAAWAGREAACALGELKNLPRGWSDKEQTGGGPEEAGKTGVRGPAPAECGLWRWWDLVLGQ